MKPNPSELTQILKQADQLYSDKQVDMALDNMALDISQKLKHTNPLLLCVLTGAIVTMGRLLCRLNFPLETDYVHATRYQGKTSGAELHWKVHPVQPIKNRTVLLVDDIFDEGVTLEALVNYCKAQGAKAVYSAVLVDKQHQRKANIHPDFIGLVAEDRYLFGCGMDYKEYWRNAPGIYAVKE